jgi:hypothetical protein
MIMRGQFGREPLQVRYLRKLKRWAFDGEPCELVDINTVPPNANLFPTLEQILQFLSDPRCESEGLSIDLEAAGRYARCLGLLMCESEDYICIHFRQQGGASYWRYSELVQIVEKLAEVLANPRIPKVIQNGQAYDVPELEDIGFEIGGYAEGGFDPMIAHRYMYGESPADLQTLGITYGGLVAWKRLVREADEGEGK